MVFFKSLTRELTLTSIGVFVVLLGILVSTQAINLLGRAAEGQIANDAVAALIGFWALGLFPVPLILTVFVSVMVVLTRLWRDHEMSVWLSAGMSQKSLLGPVLRFAIPLSILVAIVAIGIAPWADQRSQIYADQLKQREDMSAVSPGVFKESDDGNRVYFVENYAGVNGSARNIFYQDITDGKISTIFSRSGHLGVDDLGQRILVLENGTRYIGMPGQADYDVTAFHRHTVVIGSDHKLIAIPNSRQSQSTLQLLRFWSVDPGARSELAWRFSMPFSCLLLAMLAIPLSYVNPRSGHTYNLVAALLVYFLYQNMLTFVRNGILHETLPVYSIAIVHLIVFGLTWLGLFYRDRPAASFLKTLKNIASRKA